MTKQKQRPAILLACLLVLFAMFPFGSLQVQAAEKQISDIPKTNTNYQAIKWTVDNNYIQLMGGNEFQSNSTVKEWQVVQFLRSWTRPTT